MTRAAAKDTPVKGKTFTLFGSGETSDEYYRRIAELADLCLEQCPDERELIRTIQKASRKKRSLKKQLSKRHNASLISFIVNTARDMLSPYTTAVQGHLKDLSLLRRLDPTLFTIEEQYHLYMLEIELANRAFGATFQQARRKLAFLPHCLRDLDALCRSEHGEFDIICKGCSGKCYVNRVSTLLREHDIEPYLWMSADLKPLFRKLKEAEGSLGVMGVACIPELVRGMRLCMELDIPVIGVPLNANRCARWTGAFHPTSTSVEAVERLMRFARKLIF